MKFGISSARFRVEGGAASSIASPASLGAEANVQVCVEWIRLGVEVVGAVIIAAGVIAAVSAALKRQTNGFNAVRLSLARYLALALEFQLGADILSTAIAPTWDRIGKLGAIAVIRTTLNFFLMREMEHDQKTRAGGGPGIQP